MACATPNKSLMMWALAWTDMDPDQFPKNEVAKAAGFLLGLGPFAWELWRAFGNPVFPFLNQVFQSRTGCPLTGETPDSSRGRWRRRLPSLRS